MAQRCHTHGGPVTGTTTMMVRAGAAPAQAPSRWRLHHPCTTTNEAHRACRIRRKLSSRWAGMLRRLGGDADARAAVPGDYFARGEIDDRSQMVPATAWFKTTSDLEIIELR